MIHFGQECSFLLRSVLLEVDQTRQEFVVGVLERFKKHPVKGRDHDEKHATGDEMMRAYSLPARHERDQSKHDQHHDDRIKTGPLPITAAQVEPHTEFVEG